jgi:hypothetical protein
MKIAIAQSGPEDAGKTTTIRMMYGILLDRHPHATVEHLLPKRQSITADLRAVVTIGKIRIGIESQGDPWKLAARLIPSLKLFVSLRCEVIICATRTRGGTVKAVQSLKTYVLKRRTRTREVAPATREKCNRAEAHWMVEQIERMFPTATV